MNIESRIKRLEERQPITPQPWCFIVLKAGESEQDGLARWKSTNPNKPVSGNTVYFEIVDHKPINHHAC